MQWIYQNDPAGNATTGLLQRYFESPERPFRSSPMAASYFSGWLPMGKWFVGQRNGAHEIYRVLTDGSSDERLTSTGAYEPGRNAYRIANGSPSARIEAAAGLARPNGEKAHGITSDEGSCVWQISPDGRPIVFVSVPPDTKGCNDRMDQVVLRTMMVPEQNGMPSLIRTGLRICCAQRA
jgi:hypothetical protein